jgi:hypothetical protein
MIWILLLEGIGVEPAEEKVAADGDVYGLAE